MDELAELVALERVKSGRDGLDAHRHDIEVVFERHQSELFGFAWRVSGNSATAEEVVQEAFLRLISEARAGRYPNDPRAWLFRVCINLVRSRGRRQVVADRWKRHLIRVDQPLEPDQGVLGRERASAVTIALQSLSGDQRTAFLLALAGYQGPEIARLLGKSDEAARTILCRARAKIRAAVATGEAGRMIAHDQVQDLASAALDFDLTPAERAELDDHLGSCAACAHFGAGLRRDIEAARIWPDLDVPVRVRQTVFAALDGAGAISQPGRVGRLSFGLVLLLAMLALLAVVIGSSRGPSGLLAVIEGDTVYTVNPSSLERSIVATVAPLPSGQTQWPVRWSVDGRRLFFADGRAVNADGTDAIEAAYTGRGVVT